MHDDVPRHLPAQRRDLPLQVAHACFACVLGDDARHRVVPDLKHCPRQAVFPELFRDDVAAGDFELVMIEIPGELDDLHPVLQRERDGVLHVRGRDEHDAREIVVDIQIVVVEGHVLLGVQHLKEGRGRIAAEVHAHLVDFIQQHQRIDDTGPLHRLQDLSRKRSDVGPAVAPDLRFIPNAAQGDADELAAQRPGDGPGQRSLSHAGRADEAEDLSLHLPHEVQHGDVLKNPVLRFFQTKVILIEDLSHMIDPEVVAGAPVPGNRHHPVEVGPDHR